jgi:hypothetical protein
VFLSFGIVNAQLNVPRAASPGAKVSQTIGISDVTISYSRPSVKEREIWGSLVPYGYNNLGFGTATAAPWRAGANENTIITFSHNAKIEGKDIPAGTYGLHIGVMEDGNADIIFSNNSTSWGSFFYSEEEDQLRVSVKTTEVAHTERLTYDFVDIDNTSAIAVLDWEKKRFPFKVEFPVHDIVMSTAKDDLRGQLGFNWQNNLQAAFYSFQNNTHYEEGIAFADRSISQYKDFQAHAVKGLILQKMGKDVEGLASLDEAAEISDVTELNRLGNFVMGQGQVDLALKYFKLNVDRHPKDASTHSGLASCYKNMGDEKNSIKEYKKALSLSPADNVKQSSIKALKELGVDTSSYESGE